MKKILLCLSPDRQNTEALHWCLHKAKESEKKLSIIYVVDEEMARNMETSLSETGFVGDKQGEDLKKALMEEHQVRGKKMLEDLERQCRTFQISFETELAYGRYIDVCETKAKDPDIDLLVFIERKGKILKRLFEGRESDQLVGRISTEIKVFPAR